MWTNIEWVPASCALREKSGSKKCFVDGRGRMFFTTYQESLKSAPHFHRPFLCRVNRDALLQLSETIYMQHTYGFVEFEGEDIDTAIGRNLTKLWGAYMSIGVFCGWSIANEGLPASEVVSAQHFVMSQRGGVRVDEKFVTDILPRLLSDIKRTEDALLKGIAETFGPINDIQPHVLDSGLRVVLSLLNYISFVGNELSLLQLPLSYEESDVTVV